MFHKKYHDKKICDYFTETIAERIGSNGYITSKDIEAMVDKTWGLESFTGQKNLDKIWDNLSYNYCVLRGKEFAYFAVYEIIPIIECVKENYEDFKEVEPYKNSVDIAGITFEDILQHVTAIKKE